MESFLLSIMRPSIWAIVALELLLAGLLFALWRRRRGGLALCAGLLTLGLVLDAGLIALGSVLSPGLLRAVSPARFVAHGLLVPLLLPICAYALHLKKPAATAVWAVTGLLMAAGLAQALATKLELQQVNGVLRYAAGPETPRWASAISRVLSFGTVIPLMLAGIRVWIRRRSPLVFLSGFFMFAFSALGPATGNTGLIFFISMFGEVLMVLFLYLFARKESRL